MTRLEVNSTWEPNSGCRIWLGALKRDHGVIKVAGKASEVHRVAWELEVGPIPRGLWVLHTCGTAPCFNVNHLRLGTRDENASDRARHGGYRGRVGGGLQAYTRVSDAGRPRGAVADTPKLDHDELRRILSYDPEQGTFLHRPRADRDHSWNMRFVGEKAGGVDSNGYRHINMNGRHYFAHRVAWFYMTGSWPIGQIDHINGDRDDNRWANLRLATQAQNSANQGLRSNNKSGIKGVSWDKRRQRWTAMITVNRKQTNVGSFKTLEEAAAARRAAELEHHGEFARAEEVN